MDNEEFQRRRTERIAKRRRSRLLLVIAAAVIFAAVLFAVRSCGRVVSDGTTVQIEIEQGSSAKTIAKLLKENGLISSTSAFLRDLKKSEYASSLKYGEYEILRGTGNDEIIRILAAGGKNTNTITVTIPEGYSLERIIERIAEAGLSDADSLYAALDAEYDYSFLECIPEREGIKYRLQGFLFPSTYEFMKDSDAEAVINTMLAEFEKQIKREKISEKDLFETVTLASLVEREAKVESERATIAGVIKNRIAKGMRLQIDASVVYAISDGMYNVDRVLYKDLETDSPYNTYLYTGLPVGPICSPGIRSLAAAANPEQNSYYYYRVDTAKNDGSHIFTETFEEHKNAK